MRTQRVIRLPNSGATIWKAATVAAGFAKAPPIMRAGRSASRVSSSASASSMRSTRDCAIRSALRVARDSPCALIGPPALATPLAKPAAALGLGTALRRSSLVPKAGHIVLELGKARRKRRRPGANLLAQTEEHRHGQRKVEQRHASYRRKGMRIPKADDHEDRREEKRKYRQQRADDCEHQQLLDVPR